MATLHYYQHKVPFSLESGTVVSEFQIAYHIWGQPNAQRDNIVWVFHAFSGSADCFEWWKGLVGENDLINDSDYCIICANMPGSCYGSTSPTSVNPETQTPYYYQFPLWTTRDIAKAFNLLREHLNITELFLGIGGSLGGQVLLEWAIEKSAVFKKICVIASSAVHTAYGIAFNTAQRQAIELDLSWGQSHPDAGLEGLKVARSIALLSYRTAETYQLFQYGLHPDSVDYPINEQVFKASTYQIYQGEKMALRFNAHSYYALTKTMDSHDVGRNRGGLNKALQGIQARTLLLSLENDQLFPFEEQQFLNQNIPNSKLELIKTKHGHDGFLLEFAQITTCLSQFIQHNA